LRRSPVQGVDYSPPIAAAMQAPALSRAAVNCSRLVGSEGSRCSSGVPPIQSTCFQFFMSPWSTS